MANLSDKIQISIEDLEEIMGVYKLQEFIERAETRFIRQTTEIATRVADDDRVRVVFVSGPTSSGKTTFTDRLVTKLCELGKPAARISLDDYYAISQVPFDEDGRPDYESESNLDMRLASIDLARLVSGEAVVTPTFDFQVRDRIVDENKPALQVGENGVVVVEGLHGLSQQIAGHFPKEQYVGVFIMPYASVMSDNRLLDSDDLRMLRRIVRDVRHRGAHALSTIDYWPMITKSEQNYYSDYLTRADYHVNSFLIYEPLIIASTAYRDIRDSLEQYEANTLPPSVFMSRTKPPKPFADEERAVAKARMLLTWLSKIPSASSNRIPPNSILNEFLEENSKEGE
ncbi:MAG TPA: hypothetical protein PK567_01550 [Bacillota bacterium]|nr:hypothetical protein [Bacillota bacterium]